MEPRTFQHETDPALIARLQRGELAALESVYRDFQRPAYSLALRLTGRADAACDVVQDAMLKAFERARQYRSEAPFGAWLRRLVVNEALMRLRRDKRDRHEPLDDSLPDDSGAFRWPGGDSATLERALAQLPDTARAVLWLYHVEGCTHVEIADQFGRSVSFSKSQLARATRRLRRLLDPAVEDAPCMTGTATTA
ncbi:MAG TPA: RNA polymerase sigma factor [Rhodanobacteraceae bacterium]|nr:RNA polymerase sigma factor [Rhodanobacteraceae bacterium]